jgi:hypothetical protein
MTVFESMIGAPIGIYEQHNFDSCRFESASPPESLAYRKTFL